MTESKNEDQVTWNELPGTNVGVLMESSIVDIEKKLMESYGWDGPPIALATLYLSTLAGLGSISVEVMTELPDAVIEEPVPGFRHMVDLMVTDVATGDPDIEWLDEVVDKPGFMGWVLILTGHVHGNETSRVRSSMFYSRSQGVFGTERVEGQEPQYGWAPEDMICEQSETARAMVRLNELSHFVRLRNWMRTSK